MLGGRAGCIDKVRLYGSMRGWLDEWMDDYMHALLGGRIEASVACLLSCCQRGLQTLRAILEAAMLRRGAEGLQRGGEGLRRGVEKIVF